MVSAVTMFGGYQPTTIESIEHKNVSVFGRFGPRKDERRGGFAPHLGDGSGRGRNDTVILQAVVPFESL